MKAKLRGTLIFLLVAGVVATLLWSGRPHDANDGGVVHLRWATSAVGSAGHRALTGLAMLMAREMPELGIDVLPTAGAMASLRGYTLNRFDAFYGADIAFREFATDSGRFRGFAGRAEREPVQSFWTYTVEVGIAIHRRDLARYRSWRDLAGSNLFTGPAAWDVRAALDRGLEALNIPYRYRELDLGLAASALNEGTIDGFVAYTAGESTPAAWVAEAALVADMVMLNPDDTELAALADAGIATTRVPASAFRGDVGQEELVLLPFHYGFHVGMDVDADTLYRMLLVVEANAAALARGDAVFSQLADDMPGLQHRAVAASVAHVRVHPGLARYLRERGRWNADWNHRVAGD